MLAQSLHYPDRGCRPSPRCATIVAQVCHGLCDDGTNTHFGTQFAEEVRRWANFVCDFPSDVGRRFLIIGLLLSPSLNPPRAYRRESMYSTHFLTRVYCCCVLSVSCLMCNVLLTSEHGVGATGRACVKVPPIPFLPGPRFHASTFCPALLTFGLWQRWKRHGNLCGVVVFDEFSVYVQAKQNTALMQQRLHTGIQPP